MYVNCKNCGLAYDDGDRTTICPHDLIMPIEDLRQKKAGLELAGKSVSFAHQPDGPVYAISSVGWNGMVMLQGMAGEFAPHLFVVRPIDGAAA